MSAISTLHLENHGIPLPGNTLKIVDLETGEVLARGQRGEIAIKGPTLMLGHLSRRENR